MFDMFYVLATGGPTPIPWLQTVETVLMTLASSGALLFILKWVKETMDVRSHTKRRKKHESSLAHLDDLYHLMNSLLAETGAARVSIIFNSNGGGYPSLDAVRKSTMKYEVFATGHEPIKSSWQNQELDWPYTNMLNSMMGKPDKTIWNITEDLPDGILKNLYLSAGIVCGKVAYLFATNTSFIYLSIVWDLDIDRTDPKLLNNLRVRINQIQGLFESDFQP